MSIFWNNSLSGFCSMLYAYYNELKTSVYGFLIRLILERYRKWKLQIRVLKPERPDSVIRDSKLCTLESFKNINIYNFLS